MLIHRKLTAEEAAFAAVFTALYAVLGFLKISPILGLSPQAITAATIIAPIIGILLGPYLGTLCTFLGGIIGFFLGALSYPSLASGVVAASCAGMIKSGKRIFGTLTYLCLLLLFAFYPTVGPAWLFPLETWFQIAGLIILASPLQSAAKEFLNSNSNLKLLVGFFVTCLTSTLAGQVAGSLVYEILAVDATALLGYWQTLTVLYPIERTVIALAAALVGASLSRVLRSANLPPSVTRPQRAPSKPVLQRRGKC